MTPTERYVALSYLWGSSSYGISRTVRANLDKLERGIGIQELDRTFRDAVIVTHQLGIRYLWIDALCIVQDNREDFMKEVRDMDRIFSNAYCTIAASSAPDIADGFLTPQRSRAVVPMKEVDGTPISVCELIDDFQQDVDGAPLSRRGWVLQERALSRRTIFFTPAQTYWQCGDGIRCGTLTKLSQ